MVIIENNDDFNYLKKLISKTDSFWIPMFSDVYKHYTNNKISFVYFYCINEDLEYIVPINHRDCIGMDIERLQELTSECDIYVLAKKRFANFYAGKCYDADLMSWWQSNQMLPLNETNTSTHDIWNRWWHNETNTNDWLPITRHIERCSSMRKIFTDHYSKFLLSDEFKKYESYAISNFWSIEQNGVQVNKKLFTDKFQTNGIHNNKIYTEYNLYTSTGRPSNKFGGVNYAALNKEDGSRESFVSRFEKGMLLEFDYDAYHVRLIADIIKFDLPEGSIHEYFGKQYFGVNKLSKKQYEESKKITFRLLYGGIDKDFATIPFFGEVKNYVNSLWNTYKKHKKIKTPYFDRPMLKDNLNDMNPNKLFNYQLQASETEHNMLVLNELNDYMINKSSKLILYTYDSFLFDYNLNDGKDMILQLKNIISEQGKYPIKLKAGVNYNVMNDMTSKAV
jgi:hypothetical protein